MSLGFQDVFLLPDGRVGYVRDYDGGVSLDINGARVWTLPTPESLLGLRAGYLGGVIVIGQGNSSGNALVSVDGSPVMSFGLTFGVNAVAVGPDGLYVVRAADRIDVLTPAGVFLRKMAAAVGSQGIRDVTPEGEVRLGDDWFARTVAGVALYQPCQRGGLWVGQSDPPQIAGVADGFIRTTVQVGVAYEPHIAELPAGQYAVCARPWLAPVLVPPYPSYVAPAPTPEPPEPEPEPEPEPGPEPEPPDPPEEPRMIAYSDPIPAFKPADALEPHQDGDLAVRLHDRVYLACTPDGALETRDYAGGGQPGSWERFRRAKSGGALIAERGDRVYVLPLAE